MVLEQERMEKFFGLHDPSLHADYKTKLNGIREFIDNPCDAPWVVYIETFQEPFGRLVLALLSFDMSDLLRSALRPRGLRSERHTRSRRGRKRRKIGIPEPSDLVAKMLPGYEEARGRQVSQGPRTLWAIDGLGQRLLWWWMVLDLVPTFFYEWSTLINRSIYCQAQNKNRAYRDGNGAGVLAIQGWQAFQVENLRYEHGNISLSVASCSVPEGLTTITIAATMKNPRDWNADYELAITEDAAGNHQLSSSGKVTIGPQGEGEAVASHLVKGPATVYFVHKVSRGKTDSVQAMAFAIGRHE